ncbi:MAG: ABC transporter ATP-binding protein [Frankiaceae bacterium]|nr:ABC transporter ATP-binding protein [Frankiaceae bacterium]
MAEVAVSIEGVSKRFRLYAERNQSLKAALMRGRRASYEEFWALRDVDIQIPVGSTFGLIGENGSGKSTLLKVIARILQPDAGRVAVNGSLAALLELGSGFHPELSGRENVYLNGSILGLGKKQIDAKFEEIVDFAGVEQFIDQPVKNYSSGMYVRLGFAVAINVDPEILLVDEVLAVGDATFQEKCMEKFAEFRRAGRTVVIVSHAMGALRVMCDRAAWLRQGQVVKAGRAGELVDDYVDEAHLERESGRAAREAEQRQQADASPGAAASSGGIVSAARWGSGEVQLSSVELLDRHGRPTRLLRTHEQATIRLGYRCLEPIERPVFGLALDNVEGVYVWAHHSRDGGYVPERIDGEGFVDLVIPALPLQSGKFDLIASVVDYTTTHIYDFQRHCLRFDVLDTRPRESGGIVAFGGVWGPGPGGPPNAVDMANLAMEDV